MHLPPTTDLVLALITEMPGLWEVTASSFEIVKVPLNDETKIDSSFHS